jgi:MFS family permease
MSKPLELRNPPVAALLAWLVPGLGHLYQGRVAKGLMFGACILGLFLFGLQQGAWRVVYFRWDEQDWRYQYFAQVGAGLVALPALVHQPAVRAKLPPFLANYEARPSNVELDELHRTLGKRMDVAAIYTMIAGLLNLLVIYDAFAGPALYAEETQEPASPSEPRETTA